MANQKKDALDMVTASTPVNILWERILLIPVVGIIDSARAQEMMETMLVKIVEAGAGVIILDILGVPIVDSAVANHFIKITKATKLMGCECVISGISPPIAQSLVNLGVELGNVKTETTLAQAVKYAFTQFNLEVTASK